MAQIAQNNRGECFKRLLARKIVFWKFKPDRMPFFAKKRNLLKQKMTRHAHAPPAKGKVWKRAKMKNVWDPQFQVFRMQEHKIQILRGGKFKNESIFQNVATPSFWQFRMAGAPCAQIKTMVDNCRFRFSGMLRLTYCRNKNGSSSYARWDQCSIPLGAILFISPGFALSLTAPCICHYCVDALGITHRLMHWTWNHG